ncbi:MAG: hypothetical protein E7587_00210 [Ruminococcaceae bacterium]|nr:hypothetical protein [Oscillospiraceae bacterium]
MKENINKEKNEFELNLLDFFYTFKKFWALIFAVALLAAALVYLYISATFVPTYTADVKICVFNSEIDESDPFSKITNNNEYAIAAALTQSYMDILKGSRDYLDDVVANLGIAAIGYTPSKVRSEMSVGLVGESENYFYIKVTDTSANMAALIAEEIVEIFFNDIVYAGNPFLVDDVPSPERLAPSSSPAIRNSAIVFVLLFAVMLFAITLFHKNDSRICFASDIEEAVGYPVLGSIPYISEHSKKSKKISARSDERK